MVLSMVLVLSMDLVLVLSIVLSMDLVLVLSIVLSMVLVLVLNLTCSAPSLHRSFVVIGAPKASTNQSGVEEGGAVYLCPWTTGDVTSSSCNVINFEAAGVLAPPPPPAPAAVCVVCADVTSCTR